MCPFHAVLNEAAKELCSGDGACAFPADIFHVGNRAVDHFVVGLGQRETPKRVARGFACGSELVGKLITIREQSRIFAAQRHDNGASQRGQIDDIFRVIFLLNPMQRVA